MPSFAELMLCYGICFGLMNKVDFIRGKSAFTDKLLNCAYCTGFHAGWISFLLTRLAAWDFNPKALLYAPLWGFASGVFCYFIDTLGQLAESWVRKSE